LSEKLIMRKVDSFFTVILVVICLLILVFQTAQNDLGDIKIDKLQAQNLKQELELLQLQTIALSLENKSQTERAHVGLLSPKSVTQLSRTPANTSAIKKKTIKHDDEALVLSSEEQAKKMFEVALRACRLEQRRDIECVMQIEALVAQFPESVWAGQSLILLVELYIKTHRNEKALEIAQILKTDFKQNKSIQRKVSQIEKDIL
jgi:hypothetical protein